MIVMITMTLAILPTISTLLNDHHDQRSMILPGRPNSDDTMRCVLTHDIPQPLGIL